MTKERTFDLQNFSLDDLVDCGVVLRGIAASGTFEDAANAISRLFAERLVDARGERAAVLVRCYKTMRYHQLPAELRTFGRELVGQVPPEHTRCLVLLGSHGDEPAWCTRVGSRGHKAIPLLHAEFVRGIPMLRQVLHEFGLTPEEITSGDSTMLLRQREGGFNVFHVPEAVGSPYIPAQDVFVKPYGVQSVLGFGASLPTGEMVAVLIFSRAHIPARTAELFRVMALSARYVLLPRCAGPFFAGEDERSERHPDLVAERERCLTDLLSVFQRSAVSVNQSLKQITDHVTFGFLVVDRQLEIAGGHTRSCNELFDDPHLVGRTLGDVLQISDPRTRSVFDLGLEQFFDDVLTEDLLRDQLPSRFVIARRVLRVEPHSIRREGRVTHLLVTVSDETALEDARRHAATMETLVTILRQRDVFLAFLADFRRGIADARAAGAAGDHKAVRHILHTLKGNAGCFGLNEVASHIHRLESAEDWSAQSIGEAESLLSAFLQTHGSVLRMEYEGDDVVSVPRRALDELEAIARGCPPESRAALLTWRERARWRPIGQLLGPIDRLVHSLAAKLGREVALEITGGETLVDADVVAPVLRSITHAVRNAVDHGIEAPAERHPKRRQGRIDLSFSESPSSWELCVADDGRGIDIDGITERVIARGHATQEALATASEQERLMLVFADGVTTADHPTDVSGRGVGMGALRDSVRNADGDVQLWSERLVGTRILISIPKAGRLTRSDVRNHAARGRST